MQTAGVTIPGHLEFADDVTFLGRDASALTHAIGCVNKELQSVGLKIVVEKSEVLAVNSDSPIIKLDGKPIPVCTQQTAILDLDWDPAG